jgi:hypothetical protein
MFSKIKKYLIEPIGGTGSVERLNKFKNCTVLGANNSELWVYDSGNNVIKIYDNNFVHKRIIKIPKTRNYSVLDIRYRKMNDHVYVLFKDTYDPNETQYGLFEFADYHLIDTYVFTDILFKDTDAQFNRMAISEQDSNVFLCNLLITLYLRNSFLNHPKLLRFSIETDFIQTIHLFGIK